MTPEHPHNGTAAKATVSVSAGRFPAARTEPGWKRWGKNLLLLASSSLLSLLLLEGGIRFLGLDVPIVWEPDPKLGWRHIQGARRHYTEEGSGLIEINELGYRDRQRQPDKPTGIYRVIIFGDSMTESSQVNLDQTFPSLLEEKLRGQGPSVEVWNFGVNGYSPIQELLLFKQAGPRYKPDLVILALFLDNDVSGCHPALSIAPLAPFVTLDEDVLRFDYSRAEQSYADYHRQPIYTIRRFSALYRVLSHGWHRRLAAAQAQAGTADKIIPQRFRLYLPSPESSWEQAWSTLERVLMEFAAEAQRQETRLVVLSVPAGHVINPRAWQNTLDTHPAMLDKDWDLEGPDRRLKAFAQEHGLLLLQPGEVFRQAGHEPPLFFGDLGHMTARGHQLMAETLEGFLQREGILPRPERVHLGPEHGRPN